MSTDGRTGRVATDAVIAAQAREIAERAVLVPVGASLLVRDNLVSTVSGLRTKYSTRASIERELRQRRTSVERTMKQAQGRLGSLS